MMSVTSSTTPGTAENSWSAPSILTAVMAPPGIDDSSARRRALPTVVPQPRSKGCARKRPNDSLRSSSSGCTCGGRWNSCQIMRPPNYRE